MDKYVFDKMQDTVTEILVRKFEDYNENALIDKYKGITPDDKQRKLEEYEDSFGLLKEYYGKDLLELSTLKQLEGYIREFLQKLGRYTRIAENILDIMNLDEESDKIRPQGELQPLNSMNSLVIQFLKELSDQNPVALKLLKEKWLNDQQARDIKWEHSPIRIKTKPIIPADIFLEALEKVEFMNEEYQELLEEKLIEQYGPGEIKDIEANEFFEKARESGTYDNEFLDRLFARIGEFKGKDVHNLKMERKDIITARFFSGAYSRLRQMGDNLERGDDVPLGYAKRVVNNTKHIVEILKNIKDFQKYGLIQEQVNFMVTKLQAAYKNIEGSFPKDAAMDGKPVVSNIFGSAGDILQKGGIDLTPSRLNLLAQNNGGEIRFHIDTAMLEHLQNVSGFVPVIINIQPMTNLRQFLGLNVQEVLSGSV